MMHKNFKLVLMCVALVCSFIGGIGGYWGWDNSSNPEDQKKKLSGMHVRNSSVNTDHFEIDLKNAHFANQLSNSKNMLYDEFNKVTDGRVFFEKVKELPNEGGIYYARAMLNQCRNIREMLDNQFSGNSDWNDQGEHRVEVKKIEVAKILTRKCQSFLQSELTLSIEQELIALAKVKKDVLQVSSENLDEARKSNDRKAIRLALKKILALKDPLFFSIEGMKLLRHDGAIWLYGQSYPIETTAIIQAMYLVPCEFGLICDNTNYFVLSTCQKSGHCYDSLFELILKEGTGGDQDKFRSIIQFQRNIAKAIRNEDVDAFMMPLSN